MNTYNDNDIIIGKSILSISDHYKINDYHKILDFMKKINKINYKKRFRRHSI